MKKTLLMCAIVALIYTPFFLVCIYASDDTSHYFKMNCKERFIIHKDAEHFVLVCDSSNLK